MHPELIPGWPIHSYGLMLVIAFYTAYFLSRRTAKREGIDPDRMVDLMLIAAVLGIVGSRVLYVIRYPDSMEGLLDLIAIWRGGLVFYGGLVAATVGLIIYIAWKKLPLWRLADAAAPAVMLGLTFGRIGCFLNGCCWGAVSEEKFLLAVRFPRFVSSAYPAQNGLAGFVPADNEWHAVESLSAPGGRRGRVLTSKELRERLRQDPEAWRRENLTWVRRTPGPDRTVSEEKIVGSNAYLQHLVQHPGRPDGLEPDDRRSLPVHPTQLYESFAALTICGVLLLWRRWRRRPGEVFALMGCLYSVVRFAVENFRDDTAPVLGPLTMGQVSGVPVFVIAAAAFLYCRFAARQT